MDKENKACHYNTQNYIKYTNEPIGIQNIAFHKCIFQAALYVRGKISWNPYNWHIGYLERKSLSLL